MKDLKFTPGPLEIWGKQTSTKIDGFYMIGPCDNAEHPHLHTAYVSSYHDAILYSKAPDMYSALLKARSVFNILLGPAVVSSISNYDLEKKIEQALSEINKVLES